MSDKREPNYVVKSSKQQLPKVNEDGNTVVQNKDRKEEFLNQEFSTEFDNTEKLHGNEFITHKDKESLKKENDQCE